MKRHILLVSLALGLEAICSAGLFAADTQSKYDKTFGPDKNCVTARCEDGFMALHKVKGKLYAELKLDYFDKEMLIASTITGTSAADLAAVGYKPTEPMYVKFTMADTCIFLKEITNKPDYDPQDQAMERAVMISNSDPVLTSFPFFCFNNDSTAVVFEMSKFFTGKNDRLAPVKSGVSNGISITATQNNALSSTEEIKAFKDNVTIKNSLSYLVTADFMKLLLLKHNEPLTVEVTRTILLLPETGMRPRMADTRVGLFNIQRQAMNGTRDEIGRYSVITKWDVQPSDTAAWLRGELVEPVKPIVYYLDNSFPELWKEPARKGILRWNKAFEAIGFKNVIQVRDFPTDDPEFDPDNLKYSCVRYVPSIISNAMGPSWCNPSTGEIINASVIVYNNLSKLINGWRFLQTSQIDPQARGIRMTDKVMEESIEYAIAHEIGHTLGFMHNMAASAAYPVDSLRSVSFTQKYGTTASIMDYARFNYVAQPGDDGVRLSPPELGPYDYWLVEYAYKPVIGASTMEEEAKTLCTWVDAKAGDPVYRYGRQQVIYRYDPSANSEDLGDDPVKAADYGIANLKYILSHFDEWMDNDADPDATVRTERYEDLCNQYSRYIGNVMLNIGGVYLSSVKPGTPGRTATAVGKDRQHESVLWVLDQLKHSEWLSDRNLTDKFPMRLETPTLLTYYTGLELFEHTHNVMLASRIADSPEEAYTLNDFCNDLYEGIFESAIKGEAASDQDIILQNLYVQYLTGIVNKRSNLIKVGGTGLDNAYMPTVDRLVNLGLDNTGLIAGNIDLFRNLEEEMGAGYVASQTLNQFGAPGYGWQGKVNLRTIDNSKEIFHQELYKLGKMLRKTVKKCPKESRAHYEMVLHDIEWTLNR